ncbi:oxidoreductase [Bacillus sp. J14TS2]|uniref:FAD-dependent oxidoreductase n=1 Tax=Bacillus sp. J14TS2 TaxID=2807188 RepID=UPI001B032B7C|nr:FAD-dependent oxidoreductase [Bacillus sp. J14TS2]GIN71827.1 oxidoreductase [Bacillus sp. J14TS2]
MDPLPNNNQSFWKSTIKAPSYPTLSKNCEVDVAIVGGGISGILTAFSAAKAGLSVTLLEARDFVSGTTGGTSAKLTAQHQLIYDDLLNKNGVDVAKLYYQANKEGLHFIESLVQEYDIDCDYEKIDAYVYAQTKEEVEPLEKEAEAYKKLSILGGLQMDCPLDLDVHSALIMKDQAQFNPVKFSLGVLKEIDHLGGSVYQNTMVTDLKKEGNCIHLSTNSDCTVTSKHVVFTTLFPTYDPDSFYAKHLQPVTSHLLALRYPQDFPGGMYINVDRSVRSIRHTKVNDDEYLLIGGETHKTGDQHSTDDRYQQLATFAKQTFSTSEVRSYWSEHDLVTEDRRPLMGYLASEDENIYTITGLNKWGLTNAAVGAKLICNLIMEQNNPYQEIFAPNRLQANDEKEDSSLQAKAAHLKKNQAATVEIDDQQIGLFKDQNEDIHYLDLACTHLGCEVHWNDGDHTWDCPCHGSIFNSTGKVVAGPAVQDLKKVDPNDISN